MLNKVLKKMKADEKAKKIKNPKNTSVELNAKTYPTSKLHKKNGFHAKTNSQAGAERQRSMGNRLGNRANKTVGS